MLGLPARLPGDALLSLRWQALVALGRREVLALPVPAVVPSEYENHAKRRMSRAFEYFQWVIKEDVELRASDKKDLVRYAGKPRQRHMQIAAGELWKTTGQARQRGPCCSHGEEGWAQKT